MRESGFYWVFSAYLNDHLDWQIGHYDAEFKIVTVCGYSFEYDASRIVFGERIVRKV